METLIAIRADIERHGPQPWYLALEDGNDCNICAEHFIWDAPNPGTSL